LVGVDQLTILLFFSLFPFCYLSLFSFFLSFLSISLFNISEVDTFCFGVPFTTSVHFTALSFMDFIFFVVLWGVLLSVPMGKRLNGKNVVDT